jgi:hypothetical protein
LPATAKPQDRKSVGSSCKDSSEPLRFKQRQNKINKEDQRNNAGDDIQYVHDLSLHQPLTDYNESIREGEEKYCQTDINQIIHNCLHLSSTSLWDHWSKKGQEGEDRRQESIKICAIRGIWNPSPFISSTTELDRFDSPHPG